MHRPILRCALISIGLLSTFTGYAGPRVIRDNRLSDLGISPQIGRGYSVATNTFQSMCLGNSVLMTPSYDLKYNYSEIETDWESKFGSKFKHEDSFGYLFLKQNASVTVEQRGTDTYYYHYIFAKIELNTYYASLDEAQSKISETAANLLSSGDTVSFFDSCGPYYVRNLGRYSSFYALFQYSDTSQTRDSSFELELQTHLKGFFGSGSSDTEVSTEFQKKLQNKRTNISLWAYGLSKNTLADLIPTDLSSFKKSIQAAIKTMQDPNAGRVTSMEVVPWVENTQFQSLLKLKTDGDKKLFLEKMNLQDNSELLAELDRVGRAQTDLYFKAANCRKILEEEYLQVSGPYAFDPDRTYFKDLLNPGNQAKEITLASLNQTLSSDLVKSYLTSYYQFNFGQEAPVDNPESGAIACKTALSKQGLENGSYLKIPSCQAARLTLVPVVPMLDHYCMPEFSRTVPKPQS